MPSLLRARWALRFAFLSDLGTLATRALGEHGLSWGRAARAVVVLLVWAALTLALVTALAVRAREVWHGA